MDFWNSKETLQPPVHTVHCNNKIDIKGLKHAFSSILTILTKQAPLHKESAILSRFLYKYDKKFRNDIGYRKFKKVNSALRKYLTLHLIKDIKNFLELLPRNVEDSPYLPTAQMLEYVLVRIMTFSRIMSRIVICSKQSAIFYLNRIKRGDAHWMSLMPYALLSRIWSMSFVLLQHSCNWYNRLYAFIDDFTHKGLAFLPEDFKLPKDLADWIDLKNLNDEGRLDWAQKRSIDVDAILMENEEGDLCENILMYVDNINTDKDEPEVEPDMKLLAPKPVDADNSITYIKTDDIGEKISRESFKNLTNRVHSKTNKNEQHSIDNVSNMHMLQKFVTKEENYRNVSSSLSMTNHLSFMQWQTLKSTLLKLEHKVMNDRKLQMKVQKIWKEKCLDYL